LSFKIGFFQFLRSQKELVVIDIKNVFDYKLSMGKCVSTYFVSNVTHEIPPLRTCPNKVMEEEEVVSAVPKQLLPTQEMQLGDVLLQTELVTCGVMLITAIHPVVKKDQQDFNIIV